MGTLTNITHNSPHIIQLGFSQKILIILLPKLGCKITLFPHKAQHHSACGKNLKKAQNSKSPTTMWLIPKPTTMRHYLQSSLRCSISKAHCYTAPFTKPVATRQYFIKSQNHFCKTQILIWHYFTKPKY